MTIEHADRTLEEVRQDSALSYEHALAAQRLEHVIGLAIESFIAQPGRKPSRWIAAEMIRRHPGVLDAMRGGG
jgi:hypothetical protein